MNIAQLQEKVDSINKFFLNMEGGDYHLNDLIVRKTLKIGEEYGELCDAVLSHIGKQRKEKLASYSYNDLVGELADVIVSALTLARYMDIDLESLIMGKLQQVEKRINNGKY